MARSLSVGVREFFDLARVGQFSQPTELVEAYEATLRVQEAHIDELNVRDVNRSAEQIVATARRGEPLDLLAVGRDIEAGNRDRAAAQTGRLAQRIALERAGEELTTVAADLTETIITDHLRPAFEAVLDEAREPAKVVHEHPISPKDLDLSERNEVRDVRTARRRLEPLAMRRSAITQAHVRVNRLGNRRPEHDVENRFATLQKPTALSPQWQPPAKFPYPTIPSDPTEYLIWLVTTGAPCEPWMPTTAEQDEAWLAVFGEWAAQQRATSAGWARIMTN